MGCSGSKAAAGKKGDIMDEVEFEEMKIPELDDFFTSAAEPSNSMVGLNNNIKGAVMKCQETACAAKGGPRIEVEASGDFKVMKFDAGEPKEIKEAEWAAKFSEKVAAALKDLQASQTNLKAKAGAASATFTVDAGFLKAGEKVAGAPGKAARAAMSDFNGNLQAVRQADGTPTLKDVLIEAKTSLKDHMKSALSVSVDESTMQPKVDFGGLDENALPALPKLFYQAIQALVDCVKYIMEQLPQLVEQIKALVEKVQEYTPEKVKEAATSAGLNPMDAMKALKKLGTNASTLKSTPEIGSTTQGTLTDTVNALKEGLASGASPDQVKVAA